MAASGWEKFGLPYTYNVVTGNRLLPCFEEMNLNVIRGKTNKSRQICDTFRQFLENDQAEIN